MTIPTNVCMDCDPMLVMSTEKDYVIHQSEHPEHHVVRKDMAPEKQTSGETSQEVQDMLSRLLKGSES